MDKLDILLEELWDLEEWFNGIQCKLIECENEFASAYKPKYIELLFEFYNSAKDFYEITDDVCDTDDEDDIDYLMKDFKNFINCYSKLLKFFEFANVKEPLGCWIVFEKWKNKYWDIKEELNSFMEGI